MQFTQNSYKASVPLAEIDASKENPRREFGDIHALADSIRATGGQPVNPVILVRDGERYRIVDGERRYRALREVHGPDGMADALVYGDYSAAHAAVAMLATDDKMRLSEQEQARGFQTMIRLDVPGETAARVLHRKREDLRKALIVAADAPEQATLDQMICAAGFEGEDRAAVLNAAPDKYEAKAEGIRRRVEADRRRAALDAALARHGIELVDEPPGEGFNFRYVSSPENLDRLVEESDTPPTVAKRYEYGEGVYVYLPVQERQESAEDRERRELADRRRAAMHSLGDAIAEAVVHGDRLENLAKAVGRMRAGFARNEVARRLEDAGATQAETDAVTKATASAFEVVWWVTNVLGKPYDPEDVAAAVEALASDRFRLDEEDMWLYEDACLQVEEAKEEGE
jgi:hypothetical protein